jgi:cyanophycinase-like exopeptidase
MERIVRNFHSLAFTSLFWEDILTDADISNKVNEIAAATGLDVNGADKGRIKKLIKDTKEAISHNRVQETINAYLQRNPLLGNTMQAYIDWL